ADKRTDIWAIGCGLFELLTGRKAFGGETVNDTIAAVLEREPDYQALPPSTPLKIQDLIQKCLRKDVNRRLHDIADARIEMEEALLAPEPKMARRPAEPETGARKNGRRADRPAPQRRRPELQDGEVAHRSPRGAAGARGRDRPDVRFRWRRAPCRRASRGPQRHRPLQRSDPSARPRRAWARAREHLL